MSVKTGVVRYTAFGRSLPALVLAARFGEVSHLGKNGEPLLSVAFVDPARESGLSKDKDGNFIFPAGRFPQVFVEHDVVHVSHEFDDEFKKKHGSSTAEIASQRGHGEYDDFESDEEGVIAALITQLSVALSDRDAAQAEAGRQKARADLAEKTLADAKAAKPPVPEDQGQGSIQ